MQKQFKEYFTFSKREITGILVLIVLMLFIGIIPRIVEKYSKPEMIDVSDFEKQIESFEFEQIQKKEIAVAKEKKEPQYFIFDPNTVTKQDLITLGLTKKQAITFINYRKSGGVFNEKTDILKVYGLKNKLYKKLEPYIKIDSTLLKESDLVVGQKNMDAASIETDKVKVDTFRIELNKADSVDLIRLTGIGPSFSRRIISYREFLGGFAHKKQLKEVYGISDKMYDNIKDQVYVDTNKIVKLNLNTADFKTINKHPYLNYKQTKVLLKYRNLMGTIENPKVLLENNLLDTTTYHNILPYLSFN